MTGLRKRLIRLSIACGLWAVIWACNAPFIPVPPPGQTSFSTEMAPDGMGGEKTVWIAQGGPLADAASAKFFLYDDNLGAGVISLANPDGSYRAPPMDGNVGDRILIYYQKPNGDLSQTSCRLLMVGQAPPCP
jgi:hypothetical protein